jgi:hypothetical protein
MKRLLSHGYFPPELPPPFTTRKYAAFMDAAVPPAPYSFNKPDEPKYSSRPVLFNLARAGNLRRVLGIPNPVNFYQQAKLAAHFWPKLKAHFAKADRSLSRPRKTIVGERKRAFEWTKGFSALPGERSQLRTGMRYAVQTDIKSFYPSIYTHSISWALHGKEKCQANTSFYALYGNGIDRVLQNAQSRQTKGIPIGPDVSFLAAEIILTRLDINLQQEVGRRYLRFLDDYEFCCKTFAEAESTLAAFQEVLGGYELSAHEGKTTIVELPTFLEEPWTRPLRMLSLPGATKPRSQRTALMDLFDTALELHARYPDKAVIKYAITITAGEVVAKENWPLYQQLLCQLAQAEPATLPSVLDIVAAYQGAGYEVDLDQLGQLLFLLVTVHAGRGHTSEIAWVIWGHLLFKIGIQTAAAKTIAKIDNSVVALLALDARSKGLLAKQTVMKAWRGHMTPSELSGEHWLLAYEGRIKKWLPPVAAGKEYVKTTSGLGYLGNAGISFYDENASNTYSPYPKMLHLYLGLTTAAGAY